MKKKSRYLFIHSQVLVVIFLLAGCGTKPQVVINNSSAQQSSSSSSATASNKNLSPPSASSVPNKNAATNSSSIVTPTSSRQASFLRASSASSTPTQSLVTIGSSSVAQAKSSLATQSVSKNSLGKISGVITVTGKNGETLSPQGVIVNLEPTNIVDNFATNQEKRQHDVYMLNKAYTPKLMTIKENDQVVFANNDKIKHNVFSTSVGNRFDLGTYGKGEKNKVALKSSGVVKVYCNIHPEMALFISVSQHNYSHITDASGFFEIGNLPAGEYRLSAWHIRGETQQSVNIQGLNTKRNIVINTESYVPTPHKNKYDETYKVKASLFEDEFY